MARYLVILTLREAKGRDRSPAKVVNNLAGIAIPRSRCSLRMTPFEAVDG
jgi:hypothetical protein